MKKQILTLFVIAFTSFYMQAMPALSSQEIDYYKNRSLELMLNYYSSLSLIVGAQVSAAEKDEAIIGIIDEYYRNNQVTVFNDYEMDKGISHMRIAEYLDQLNALYGGERMGAMFSDPSVKVIGVFQNSDFFSIKLEVNRTFACSSKPELNNTRTIDYYFNFYPNNKELKLFSMTEHIENATSLTPVAVSEKPVISFQPNGQANPSVLKFNIIPNHYSVSINGQDRYAVNGMPMASMVGKCNIEISAPNYQTYTLSSYEIKEGENLVSVSLTPRMGTLSLKTQGKQEIGAAVVIDGKQVGTLPLDRYPLMEGKHNIKVTKTGFFNTSRNIKIKAEQDETRKMDLVDIEKTKTGLKIAGGVLLNILGAH